MRLASASPMFCDRQVAAPERFRSRLAAILAHSFPTEQARASALELLHFYSQQGYPVEELTPIVVFVVALAGCVKYLFLFLFCVCLLGGCVCVLPLLRLFKLIHAGGIASLDTIAVFVAFKATPRTPRFVQLQKNWNLHRARGLEC